MTRAEERALERYPVEDGKMWISEFGKLEFDRNYGERQAFQEGYEQAEKDMIERAIKWLKANADSYIVDMQVSRMLPPELHIGGMCWEDFKKAMEEEHCESHD